MIHERSGHPRPTRWLGASTGGAAGGEGARRNRASGPTYCACQRAQAGKCRAAQARGYGARRLHCRCPHWGAGRGDSACRGRDEAATDRHVHTHTAAKPGKTLGSTATNVLRNAPCPVVLVPPGRDSIAWHLQHVLVPHDGTPTTSAALRPAAELAERASAELLVAHVTGIRAAPAEPGSLTAPRYVDQPQHEWPAWTREFVKRLECICPLGHLHVRMVLAHGNPAAEIVRLAKKQAADLMVLAWRGKWEVPRAVTLKDILREAQCPIMVVRA